ncbi:uncharacterized protein LOC118434421 [Folsomia candida]|uniref:Uncharacterized protein n=1 Tax=Folsomia candida TaxID=158441 RepID=A0A226F6N7_FOLCA|nr:uncharacterized protein LOC118434421 [Folsomia candida]OXA65118.1 hypothetical protein Fcan01_02471 [Folsomia candida]
MFWRSCLLLAASVKLSFGISYHHNTSLILSPRDSGGWGSSGWGGSGWGGSEHGVHSFFDIALTALAFMSFGIFLLNLLMNALFLTTTQGLTSTGPIITSIDTGTGGGTDGETTVAPASTFIYIRKKRAAMLELSVDRASAANALAATVLKSIDAMISKYECLPKVFCEGNRQGKVIGYGFQYSMPLFSFSSSFIGEKLGLHKKLTEHLDAILHGLAESNCKSQFSQCSQ